MADFDILKAAAQRIQGWETKHGVFANWNFDTIGLELVAHYGGNHVAQRVSWFDLEQSRYPTNTLERVEAAVLAGLSN